MKAVLIGAYGYTAGLIAELLDQHHITFSVAGKNQSKLEALKNQYVSVDRICLLDISDYNQLEKFINEYDLFINCAGPFTEESSLFIEQIAASQNKIYLDITGESEFIKSSLEKRHLVALGNNTQIIHGCAFESTIAELALALSIKPTDQLQTCRSFYLFTHSKPSPGTRMTMKLSKFRKFTCVKNGIWQAVENQKDRLSVKLNDTDLIAVPYPLPEIIFFHSRFQAQNTQTYLLLKKEEAFISGAASSIGKDLGAELERLKKVKILGPTATERAAQKFELTLEIETTQSKKFIAVKGSDMYNITARLMVILVDHLMRNQSKRRGVISPGEALEGFEHEILNALSVTCSENTTFQLLNV